MNLFRFVILFIITNQIPTAELRFSRTRAFVVIMQILLSFRTSQKLKQI